MTPDPCHIPTIKKVRIAESTIVKFILFFKNSNFLKTDTSGKKIYSLINRVKVMFQFFQNSIIDVCLKGELKLKGTLLRPLQVEIDPDFFGKRHKKEMYDAQYAKFTQNEPLKQLLLATNDAKLTHYKKGAPPDLFEDLMLIRDKIRKTEI